jgi:hypothetical protein
MEKENGRRCRICRIATAMRENTKTTRRMDMVFSIGRAGTSTRETIRMMKEMVLERCSGLTGIGIRVNGSKESSMVRVK